MTVGLRVSVLDIEAPRRADPVSSACPALSWLIEAADPTWTQASAELRWENGERTETVTHLGADRTRVPWPFPPLQAHDQGTLVLRVTGTDGSLSLWSEPVAVVAAFLNDAEWDARWIGHPAPEHHAQPVMLQCPFDASGVVRATLYASAVGSYQAALNGTDVDDQVLKPGWTPFAKRTVHDTTDVTSLVRDGSNILTIRLAGTWATEHFGFRQNAQPRYGDQPRAAAQLLLEHADGARQWVRTDDQWLAATGLTVRSGLYEGEHADGRLAAPTSWRPVRVFPDERTPSARISPPVRRIEQRLPVSATRGDDGTLLLDFGQNLVGRLRLRVSGEAGTTITLRHAEVLENGALGIRPLRRAISTDSYTLAGGGVEEWEPEFTFHGFRYAEVSGWPGTLTPGDITAVVIHSDLRRTGWFQTSHPGLQQLHDNIVWSLRGNFLSIPTDCPQRDERLGWTGDIQIFAPTATFLYDVRAFLDSWLRDLSLEQDPTGVVPFVVPDVIGLARPAAAWGDAAVVVPDVLHRQYGDRATLQRQYPGARAWVELCLRLAGPSRVWEGGFQFGDWLDPTAPPGRPDRAMTATGLVATAYLARSARLLAEAAATLGDVQDAERYASEAVEVRAAFVREYVTGAGRLMSDTPTAYALALVFDLLPAEVRPAASARLADLVRENGYRISTGFVGTPVILDALTGAGYESEAGRLLLETGCPSWLYPVTMGATTVWERWDSMLPDGSINPGAMTSFNHYAFGAVADWMHRELAGLTVLEPGARRLRIAPHPLPGIDDAQVVYDSPSGRIEVGWRRDGEVVRVDAAVPAGVEAEVALPGRAPLMCGAGEYAWSFPAPVAALPGRVGLDSSLAQVMDDWEALRVVEDALAAHRPGAVEAMRAGTRWTRGQTLAELVFQHASPAVQADIGRRLDGLSQRRGDAARA